MTGDVYLAVCFTIHLREDVDEDGNIREGVGPFIPAEVESRKDEVETSADDVD